MPNITLIVAKANNNVIGKDNQMLWHLPKDLQFFKRQTLNHTVIMGRKTWQSLPIHPLPQRENIILSRTPDKVTPTPSTAVKVYSDINAIDWQPDKNYMVMGGEAIYRLFLPLANRLIITHVDCDLEGDRSFPTIDLTQSQERQEWQEIETESNLPDSQHQYPFKWCTYQKYTA